MQSRFFNSEYLGDQTPWFGPLLKGYRTIVSSATMALTKGYSYDVTVWIRDDVGNLLDERVLRTCKAGDMVTIDVQAEFPAAKNLSGIISVLCHAQGMRTPKAIENWVTRVISPSGKLTTAITSGNPGNLNFTARSGRPYAYRMCSQELLVDPHWKTLSWHANVSGDPTYNKTIHPSLIAINEQGEQLHSDPLAIPPFGAALIDIEAVFGERLKRHLGGNKGRGSYMMQASDGGAMGYHFLQNRKTGELAGDHTRPVLLHISAGYGATKDSGGRSIGAFLRSSAQYMRFRAGL